MTMVINSALPHRPGKRIFENSFSENSNFLFPSRLYAPLRLGPVHDQLWRPVRGFLRRPAINPDYPGYSLAE